MIYLDNNATTKPDDRVVDAMLPFLREHYGNAASTTHIFGWEAKDAVDQARERVAELIHADPKEIIFTSGATESVNLALKGMMSRRSANGKHIITCVTEHKAVLDTCRHLEDDGYTVSYIPVDSNGIINLEMLESAIRDDTVMIAAMWANNETGVLQPIPEIAAIAKSKNILLFTDATQAIGKTDIDPTKTGMDLMAFSAHKFYGPKGIGALFINRKTGGAKPVAQMDGGGHERGVRSGTLNVPAIVGFGKAAEIAISEMITDEGKIRTLRDLLERELLNISGTHLNGHPKIRMFNVTNISFDGVEAQQFMMTISKQLAVSSGSACSSAVQEPSYVLKAMGIADESAMNAIRFSAGRFNTKEEIESAIIHIRSTLEKLRS